MTNENIFYTVLAEILQKRAKHHNCAKRFFVQESTAVLLVIHKFFDSFLVLVPAQSLFETGVQTDAANVQVRAEIALLDRPESGAEHGPEILLLLQRERFGQVAWLRFLSLGGEHWSESLVKEQNPDDAKE